MKRTNGSKCCLLVLDGWGYNPEERKDVVVDSISDACPKTMTMLSAKYFSTLLKAHGTDVGLSTDAMMGNSEVGHLTIGAGRVVLQDSVRIRKTFEAHQSGRIADQVLGNTLSVGTIHIWGILSDGNIHGHWKDLLDVACLLSPHSQSVYIHTVSDGRDTRPAEYLTYLSEIVKHLPANAQIVSVSGRFYAMDRDKREERTRLACAALTFSSPSPSPSPAQPRPVDLSGSVSTLEAYVKEQYAQGITDEFILPFCIKGCEIQKGEKLVITNFRVDRVKQIYYSLSAQADVFTMTRVDGSQAENKVLFERPPIQNTLPEVIEAAGLSQARIAETEKAAHVTFFFNGGKDASFQRETRTIIPSKKVDSYDTVPGMSVNEVSKTICQAMEAGTDFIFANIANPDMVGHTGNAKATTVAIGEVDRAVGRIYACALKEKYVLVITADHGNAEIMKDNKGVVKSHTTNPVPIIVVSDATQRASPPGATSWGFVPSPSASLIDVAPTVLTLLGLPIPSDMTGKGLLPVASA
ncbi:2,3-bisphosphoglycerate-independent phosphoglycerate mutase [Nematocida displodere]|uniref:phosphoglycerate mutase (2,3-diphosphoglycerate-independent) n=1 Tax=Nematocida displodere TaxID=1805483 RepID=A0A177ECR4_9MICR|nr:2,3-bisphosphoglycerate-independent phosphoglycerate mutase [Nematocida displodere]